MIPGYPFYRYRLVSKSESAAPVWRPGPANDPWIPRFGSKVLCQKLAKLVCESVAEWSKASAFWSEGREIEPYRGHVDLDTYTNGLIWLRVLPKSGSSVVGWFTNPLKKTCVKFGFSDTDFFGKHTQHDMVCQKEKKTGSWTHDPWISTVGSGSQIEDNWFQNRGKRSRFARKDTQPDGQKENRFGVSDSWPLILDITF